MAKSKKEIVPENSGDRFTDILNKMNKASAEPTFMILDDASHIEGIPVCSTGVLSIDRILGVGGFPCGRIIEIYGQEAGGKSTLCAQTVAEAQRAGGVCAYIDNEHGVDVSYFRKLGVNFSTLLFTQPNSGEEALTIVDNLVPLLKQGDVLIVDSVAALTPQAEINGEIGDQFMGLQARMMSQALRRLTSKVSDSGATLIFINQIRQKIGVTYGSNESTTGGNALKFWASVRVDIRKIGQIKKGEEVIGSKVKVKVVKNRVAPPFRECEVEMIFGEGISPIRDLITNAIEVGVIEKGGAWLTIGANRVQGMDNAFQLLKNDPELYAQIYAQTIDALKNKA